MGVERGWCSGRDGGARGAGGARAAVRPARGGVMRGRAVLAAVCACVVLASALGRELRVLQADARAAFYVGIAAPPSAAAVVHAFNRSLAEISHTYLAGDYPLYLRNITLLPLYIELPEDEK